MHDNTSIIIHVKIPYHICIALYNALLSLYICLVQLSHTPFYMYRPIYYPRSLAKVIYVPETAYIHINTLHIATTNPVLSGSVHLVAKSHGQMDFSEFS